MKTILTSGLLASVLLASPVYAQDLGPLKDNEACVDLFDFAGPNPWTGPINYRRPLSPNNNPFKPDAVKGCSGNTSIRVEVGSCRTTNYPNPKVKLKQAECLYKGEWVTGYDIYKQQTQPSQKSSAPATQINSPASRGVAHSKPNAVSISPLDSSVPSVMAKDYWVNVINAEIYDASNNVIGSLGHSTAVTTYGEKDGLGKIDLIQEKWVKLSNLSVTKPAPQAIKSPVAVSANSVTKTVEPIAKRPIFVPSDPKASYYLIEKVPLGNNLSIVTKRAGPSGESFSKREIDCNQTKFRYLGDGRTIDEMNAPYDVGSMRLAEKGDVYTKISYDILKDICPKAANTQTTKLKDSLNLKRYVSADPLNYRDAPNGAKLGTVTFGSEVTVYEKKNGWYRISRGDRRQEWVHGDYLSNAKPVKQKAVRQTTNTRRRYDDSRYDYSRKLSVLKSKCSYRNMVDFLDGRYDSGGCRYVAAILRQDTRHPYIQAMTDYANGR